MPLRKKLQTYIIVENEKLSANRLKKMIHALFPKFQLLEICDTSDEAIAAISELAPDLVFVDIKLENNTLSFQLFDKVPPDDYKIIFISDKTDHHNNIFDYQVVDIITKPYKDADIIQAVKNAEKRNFITLNEIHNLEHNYNQHDVLDMSYAYAVETIGDEGEKTEEIYFIKYRDIVAFEAYKSRKSLIISADPAFNKQLYTTHALSKLRGHLPNCFYYTRSIIVNIHHIETYNVDDHELFLTGGRVYARITPEDFEEMQSRITGFKML